MHISSQNILDHQKRRRDSIFETRFQGLECGTLGLECDSAGGHFPNLKFGRRRPRSPSADKYLPTGRGSKTRPGRCLPFGVGRGEGEGVGDGNGKGLQMDPRGEREGEEEVKVERERDG